MLVGFADETGSRINVLSVELGKLTAVAGDLTPSAADKSTDSSERKKEK